MKVHVFLQFFIYLSLLILPIVSRSIPSLYSEKGKCQAMDLVEPLNWWNEIITKLTKTC